jgi:hypothetical protein
MEREMERERERDGERWRDGDAKENRHLAVLSSINWGPASRVAYSTICSAVLPPLKSLTVLPASLNTLRVGKDVAPYLLQMGLWAVQSTLPSLTLMPSFSCERARLLGMHQSSGIDCLPLVLTATRKSVWSETCRRAYWMAAIGRG